MRNNKMAERHKPKCFLDSPLIQKFKASVSSVIFGFNLAVLLLV